MAKQSSGEPASGLETDSRPTKILERVGRVWRRRGAERLVAARPLGGPAPDPASADAGYQSRFEALEARMGHLEAALEGLQDAVYRQAVLGDKRDDELRRRTDPHELARELGRDARKRGV